MMKKILITVISIIVIMGIGIAVYALACETVGNHNAWGSPSYGGWGQCIPNEGFDACLGGDGTQSRTVTETCIEVSGNGSDQCDINKVYGNCPAGYTVKISDNTKCRKTGHPDINRPFTLVPETQTTNETQACIISPDTETCPEAGTCPTQCGLEASTIPDGQGGEIQCEATEACQEAGVCPTECGLEASQVPDGEGGFIQCEATLPCPINGG
jgi:hypothetical protein